MSIINRNRRQIGGILAGLALILAACSSAPQTVEVTRIVPQTVVVTQLATVIVTNILETTPNPTATQAPTATSAFAFNVYFPIPGCPASRLRVGDLAYVSYDGGRNAIRDTPSTAPGDNVIGYADPGEQMVIIDGPVCDYSWLVWKVRLGDGMEGWTPEGNGDEYWLIPNQ